MSPPLPHDGPPYPIAEEAQLGGRTVSIWADPDVGVGSFFLYVEPRPSHADEFSIAITAAPDDGHAPAERVVSEATPDAPYALLGEVPFDRRGSWTLRFEVLGGSSESSLSIPVDVTPPGSLGPFDIALYLFPFLLVAGLWFEALRRQRRHDLDQVPR